MTVRATLLDSLRHPRGQLLLLLLVALAARALALIHGAAVTAPHGDEVYYLKQGWSIAQGLGYPGSFRPPLYSLLIGGVFATFGENLLALRLVQVVVSLAAVVLVHEICRARFGSRAALWTGAACAIAPGLVHFSHFLWAETLFITLFLLFLWLLRRFAADGRTSDLVGAALALAFAALTKEIVVFFSILMLPWFAWRAAPNWRAAARHGLIFMVCFVGPLAPWIVRNQAVNGEFVGLSTCRWFPIAMGNLRAEDERFGSTERVEFQQRWRGTTGEVEREHISRDAALRSIRAQQPAWLPYKIRMTLLRLFSPKAQEVRFLELGLYPRDMGPTAARGLVALTLAGHLLLLTPGLMALWLIRGDPLKPIVVAMILYSAAIYTLANSTPRFLVPLLPLFYLYIGPWFAGGHRGAERWRWLAAAITAAAFVAVVLLQLPDQLGPVWSALGRR